MAICIGLDLLMFMWGPMKMSFIDYMKDIGLTYLMLPIIAAGVGLACGSIKPKRFDGKFGTGNSHSLW